MRCDGSVESDSFIGEEYALQHAHSQPVPCDEINPEDLHYIELAGRGAFGQVWRVCF